MELDISHTQFIKDRRSIRRFLTTPVPEEIIRDILECGRLAPTAHNGQHWLMGAVTDSDLKNRIADLVENGRFISQSAVCFAMFTSPINNYWLEDGCAATMNIITAAAAHGVATCWVAGARKGYATSVHALLGVPAEFSLVALVAAGYPAKISLSTKRPFNEVTFRGFCTTHDNQNTDLPAGKTMASVKSVLCHRLRALVLKWL
jgi:nitroreductase